MVPISQLFLHQCKRFRIRLQQHNTCIDTRRLLMKWQVIACAPRRMTPHLRIAYRVTMLWYR